LIYTYIAWTSTNIQQDAYVRVQDGSKRIKEPPVRVDLLGIVFLHTKHDLDWHNSFISTFEG
jgi:hypothetical protein